MIAKKVCRDNTEVIWFTSQERGVEQVNTECSDGMKVVTNLHTRFLTYLINVGGGEIYRTLDAKYMPMFERKYPDGRVRRIFFQGEIKTTYPDGYIELLLPDFRVFVSGYPGGELEVWHSDGTVA